MAVLEGGVSGLIQEVGLGAAIPGHVTAKPIPQSGLGHYRWSGVTGTIAAALAASAQLWYFRWTDATRLAVITRIRAQFQTLTPFTANTLTDFGFDLFKATGISAGAGGTQVLGSAVSKMRTSMGNSLIADMRIATTAALTALTTLDGNPITQSIGDPNLTNPAGGTEEPRVNDPTLIYQCDMAGGEHPIVLAQNEGLVIRNRTVWPAAGTGVLQVELAWAETTLF